MISVMLMSVMAMFCACKENVDNAHKMTSSLIDKVTMDYQSEVNGEINSIKIENADVIQKLVEIYNNRIDDSIKSCLDRKKLDRPIPETPPIEFPRMTISFHENEIIVMEIILDKDVVSLGALNVQTVLNDEFVYDEFYKIYLGNKQNA